MDLAYDSVATKPGQRKISCEHNLKYGTTQPETKLINWYMTTYNLLSAKPEQQENVVNKE